MSVALGALFAAGLAHATDITVVDGETLTVPQILSGAGDTLTVETGGAIEVVTDTAVSATGSGVTITNAGKIWGLMSAVELGDGNTLYNSGTMTGVVISGIRVGSANSVTNSGTIVNDYGAVNVTGTGNEIVNSGSMVGGVAGISLDAGNNTITNSGLIEGGQSGIKASLLSSGNTIINSSSGQIIAGIIGIDLYGSGNEVINAGYVYGDYAAIGSYIGSSITNTGTVEAGYIGVLLIDDSTLVNSGDIDGVYGGVVAVEDGNVIENASKITGGRDGVVFLGNENSLLNSGFIQGNTATGWGVYVTGTENQITNSGTIDGFYGIGLYSNGNTVTNSGTISGQFVGIDAGTGNGNTLLNTGLVSSLNDGIRVCGSNQVANSGTVSASGTGIRGCDGETITNAGTITAGTYGIRLLGDGNAAVNTGEIGGATVGIEAMGDDNVIENSGTLSGATFAVSFQGSGNSLELLNGSIVEGTLAMGTGNSVAFDDGMTAVMAYTGTPTATAASGFLIDTGSELVTLDTTGFSAEDDQLNDLTRAINDTIDQRLVASRRPGGDYAQVSGGMQVRPVADAGRGDDGAFWMAGFGSYQTQDADGQGMGWDALLGGGTLGFDQAVSDKLRLGGLVGFAASRFSSDGSEKITTNSYFLGGYAGYDMGRIFVDATLFGGLSDFTQKREVLDNTITGGTETVETDHNGWFINPSLTLGAPIAAGNGTFTPSVRARYAAVSLEDYTEQWNAVDVSFDSRVVSLVDLRGQAAYDFDVAGEGGTLSLGLRAGVDVTIADADDVEAQAATASLNFNTYGQGATWRGFTGVDVAYKTDAIGRLFLGAEVGLSSGGAAFEGRAGFDLAL
jgi:uncharacterized protein with beta-barrel porin domain